MGKNNITWLYATAFYLIMLHFPMNGEKGKDMVLFTENKGQVSDQYNKQRPDVLFSGTNGNCTFHLQKSGISYQYLRVNEWATVTNKFGMDHTQPRDVSIYRIDVSWIGAKSNARVIGKDILPDFTNYYCFGAPQGILKVKSYKEVYYYDVYDGIDLHYYGQADQLKYDYIIGPGVDYRIIKMEINGADAITLNADGSVTLATELGRFTEEAPLVYQGKRKIGARWVVENNQLSFELDAYDPSKELIIDPLVRAWGTWYGGGENDAIGACYADKFGNVYACGSTASVFGSIIATVGSHQYNAGPAPWSGAFLTKFNNAGQRKWGTYYGGGDWDGASSCIVNQQGEVYLTGSTSVLYAPALIATPGAHQTVYGSTSILHGRDAFLAKFDSNGVRIWGTYYGGSNEESGSALALDPAGNVYMAGSTKSSASISTIGSHQVNYGGGTNNPYDGFLVKFNSSGVRQWGTYYGGTGVEVVVGLSVDTSYNVFISGYTSGSSNLVTAGAHQTSYGGGSLYIDYDGFIAKFNSFGVRQWGTYYGGNDGDVGAECVADNNGNVYFVGYTYSTNTVAIATPGAHQTSLTTGTAAFLVKFNSTGARQWGTYFGQVYVCGLATAMNAVGDIYMAGVANSGTLALTTNGVHQPANGGGQDAFYARFNPSGIWKECSYYGGINTQYFHSISTNTLNQVFCAGISSLSPSPAIATSGSHQYNYGGMYDGILVKFTECSDTNSAPTLAAGQTQVFCENDEISLQMTSNGEVSWYAVPGSTSAIATGLTYSTNALSAGTYTWYANAKTCNETSSLTAVTITVSACTGLVDSAVKSSILNAYPNPCNGLFTLESTEPLFIKVFSFSGSELLNSQLGIGLNECHLEHFPNGIYFLQAISDHQVHCIKLVKE